MTTPVAFGVTLPATGECAGTDFGGVAQGCKLKGKGKKLVCK